MRGSSGAASGQARREAIDPCRGPDLSRRPGGRPRKDNAETMPMAGGLGRSVSEKRVECNAGHLTRHRERHGTFAEIATDLALDGARVPAIAPCGQDEEREIVEERVDAAGQRAGWGEPGGVPEGTQGEERVAIAQA